MRDEDEKIVKKIIGEAIIELLLNLWNDNKITFSELYNYLERSPCVEVNIAEIYSPITFNKADFFKSRKLYII